MKGPLKSRPRRHARHALLTIALPLVTTAGCHAGGAQEPAEQAQEPMPVRTAAVAFDSIARPILATGTFGPKDEVALSFKVGGVIERVDVDAGARVRGGQALASLDLREIDAALAKARSGAAKAERDLERLIRLYADSVATLSQLQDAETVAELARADLQAAAFHRDYAVIIAPADGVILARSAEAGETVSTGTPVLVLGSGARGGVLRVGLADRDAVRVRVGTVAAATFDALPGRTFSGRVTEVGASATTATGTYTIEIALAGAAELPAGLIGRATITSANGAMTAMVPVEAVLEADGNDAVVYVLSPDGTRAERRRVTVSMLDGDRVAVASGLEGATTVVTDGAGWLRDGSAVSVVR
jgi:RND family efflux transporter MFP subunit